MSTSRVKIAQFRQSLSFYLNKVRHGDEVIITERDTPLGRLLPFASTDKKNLLHLIEPPQDYQGLSKIRFPVSGKSLGIVDLLLEDRQKR